MPNEESYGIPIPAKTLTPEEANTIKAIEATTTALNSLISSAQKLGIKCTPNVLYSEFDRESFRLAIGTYVKKQ